MEVSQMNIKILSRGVAEVIDRLYHKQGEKMRYTISEIDGKKYLCFFYNVEEWEKFELQEDSNHE